MIAITVADDLQKCERLRQSLELNGWNYHFIRSEWRGFGTKLIRLKEYLETTDIDRFVFVDGYDVICLGNPSEMPETCIGTEINCWPDADKASLFPQTETHYKYPNSGCYTMEKDLFIKLFNDTPPNFQDDDQRWMTDMALKYSIKLDYNRELVQNTCGMLPSCGSMQDNRFITDIGTKPIFIHGNGKGDLTPYEPLRTT